MMRIEEYFEIIKLSFYGPLAPSVVVSGPSLIIGKRYGFFHTNHKFVVNTARITFKGQIISFCPLFGEI